MTVDTKGVSSRLPVACAALAVALVVGACGSAEAPDTDVAPAQGPPEVVLNTVEQHARQFDDDLPVREAGTQQELAAATYLTGHLQRAGYTVRLESVPVGDLVRSTDVVALPPSGGAPRAVVAVPYDTLPGLPPQGEDLGVFLELARALRVEQSSHAVEFVALGAELTDRDGGSLGTRRLVRLLVDAEVVPPVVVIAVSPGRGFDATGTGVASDLDEIASSDGLEPPVDAADPMLPRLVESTKVLGAANLDFAVAQGGAEEVGSVLLSWLEGRSR
jgi:hypothetical protein